MKNLIFLTSVFRGYSPAETELLSIVHIVFVLGLIGFSVWIFIIKQQLKKRTIELQKLNDNLEEQVNLKTSQYQNLSEKLLDRNAQLDKAITKLSIQNTWFAEIAAKLEINEVKYRSFISQSGDGIAIINQQGRIIEWNKKMESITGFEHSEVLNREMSEIEFNLLPLKDITKERRESLQQKYKADLSQIEMKEPFTFEEEIYNNRGESKRITSLLFPIITKNEMYVGCITRDITNEINQKENEFGAKLLQLVQNLVMVLDMEGRIIRFNDAYEYLTGYNKDEIFYRYFWDINYPLDQREKIKSRFHANSKSDIPCEIKSFIYTKDGALKNIFWKCNSLKDENGSNQFLIFSGTDITDILKQEEALVLSELRFRRMFEKQLTGIILYEPIFDENSEITDIRYIEVNPGFQEQTGTSPDKLIGKTFREVFPDDYPVFIDEYKSFKKDGRYINYEQYLASKNKYFRIQHFELVPGLMALTLDNVTEQKRMEQRLIETVINIEERGHKRIARDLHDEVGPQLASMNVYVSSLTRKIENPEQLKILQLLKELIKESIAHIREISNNLTPHIIEKYGLIAAVSSEIDSMKLIVPVTFNHQISDTRFDSKIEISVYRIIKELLNNTKKYAQATNIELSINVNSDTLKIDFCDNGIGFDYENKMKNGDVGMGLLNIESRVKALHGKCFIKSEESKGFKFSVSIPVNPKKH